MTNEFVSDPTHMPADPAQPVTEPWSWTRAMLAADFERNTYPFERITLLCVRLRRAWHNQPGVKAWAIRKALYVFKVVWLDGFVGAEIPAEVHIGPGLAVPHSLRGTMINASTRIGARARIFHQVTIGARDENGAPTLGDDVVIGAGAKVLGPITIADGTRIGANAVVVKDTVAHGTYVCGAAELVEPRTVPDLRSIQVAQYQGSWAAAPNVAVDGAGAATNPAPQPVPATSAAVRAVKG